MWINSKRVAAFTLLECLTALLVVSGSLLVFQGLTRLVGQEIHYQTSHEERNWLVFSQQFRQELEGVHFVKVEGNRLYVQKGNQELAFGKSKADDFRKTNGKGQGYQPMLYKIQAAEMTQNQEEISIYFVFENGMERTFIYDFSGKG